MMRKRDNYVGKVPNDSTSYAAKGAGNLVPKDLSRSNSPLPVQERVIAQGSRVSRAHSNCIPQSNYAVDPAGEIAGIKSLGSTAVSHTGNSTREIRNQKKNVQPASGSRTSNNIMEDKPASKYQPPLSSSLNVVKDAGQNVENIKVLPGVPEEDSKNGASSKLLIPGEEAQTFCCPQNDLRSLCRAVNEAHRAQLAIEAINICKGYPVAEFEKLLCAASPVICPSVNIRTCRGCVLGQGSPLCRHEIPNIILGNLWQWYEKHGSYGLEVKAEEHKSCNQCGIDRIKFSAYFVPSLSAVQLFKSKDNGTLRSVDVVESGKNKMSESSSTVDLNTIFSRLIPRPRVEESSSLQKGNVVSDSRSSSKYSHTELHHPPVEDKSSDANMELLFEYFEREQPQSRKPLHLKIQELIAGSRPSNSGVHEDPSILQSARLSDLHPHSWFCVAWYPIYRIPNGSFRAAFLTYHSLGHYVHRIQALDARRLDPCVVSPVVGLQSYNAQGECWFQPRHSTDHMKEVTSDSDPAAVLRDRLETLELTASLMSRAVRMNGTERIMNRHSDYEFFLSRRRRLY